MVQFRENIGTVFEEKRSALALRLPAMRQRIANQGSAPERRVEIYLPRFWGARSENGARPSRRGMKIHDYRAGFMAMRVGTKRILGAPPAIRPEKEFAINDNVPHLAGRRGRHNDYDDTRTRYNDRMEETIRVQLNFPLEQVKKPIIWHLSHDFGLKFSIRRANIDFHAGGFTVLELTGPAEKIEAGLEWVRSEGVETTLVALNAANEYTE
jgi:hypothetical protein